MNTVSQVNCPACGVVVRWEPASEHRPFCSRRCRDGDLLDWAEGRHAIPGEPVPSTTANDED